MLYNGQYFRKGTKRALEELRQLGLPFDPEARILAVIQAETVEKIRAELTEVFALTDEYLAEYEKGYSVHFLLLLSFRTFGYGLCFAITYGYNAYFGDNSIANAVIFCVRGRRQQGLSCVQASYKGNITDEITDALSDNGIFLLIAKGFTP